MINFVRRALVAFQAWGTYDFLDKFGFIFVTTYLVVLVIGGTFSITNYT